MSRHAATLVAVLIALCACSGSGDDQIETVAEADNQALPMSSEEAAQSEALPAAAQLAQADTRFELGTHYQLLTPTQPTGSGPDEVEVAEVFWYGCPHCYAFEPYLEAWQPAAANYIRFVRIPAVWNPTLRLHAQLFYTAEALGKLEEMHAAIFREIHVGGNYLDSEQKLVELFGRFGVGEDAFRNAFNSFTVNTKLQRAEELNRRYRISSVPSIVINGKYTTNATMAQSYEGLLDLIDELAAREHGEN